MRPSCAAPEPLVVGIPLSAAELPARRRTPGCPGAARTLVRVPEDRPGLLPIVGRHLDCRPVACQRLDTILLHLARCVGDYFMAGIELDTIPRIGKDFGHQS